MTLYVDGDFKDVGDSVGLNHTSYNWKIGDGSDGAGDWNGTIDEVMIFNRSLGAEEVSALYNATANQYYHNFTELGEGMHNYTAYGVDIAGNVNASGGRLFTVDTQFPTINFTTLTPSNGSSKASADIFVNLTTVDAGDSYAFADFDNDLVGWWRMDVLNSSGNVVDESSYGNNGTVVADAVQTDAGKFGKGFEFDGDGDYVLATEMPEINRSLNFTVSMWVKNAGNDTYRGGLAHNTVDSSNRFVLDFNNGDVRARVWNGGAYKGSFAGSITGGEWAHVVYTWQSNETGILYIDNAVQATAGGGDSSTSTEFRIGRMSSSYFNGSIDEVLIFNRTLDAVEVAALYNASANQYYHNFTELSDATHNFTGYVVDSAGNLNSTDTWFVTTDASPPTISVVSPVNASTYNSSSILVNVSSSDEGTGMIVPNLDSSLVSW
ncbi:MAG: hypothetical protein QF704_12585, partial [Anaerolineales bacterium]|nr:hypothetical protein [Anaerolineales bacterium]